MALLCVDTQITAFQKRFWKAVFSGPGSCSAGKYNKQRSKDDENDEIRTMPAAHSGTGILSGACAAQEQEPTVPETQPSTEPSTAASDPQTEPAEESYEPVTITTYDYEGNEITTTYDKTPERVLCVYQGCIETMIALGLEDRVVACYGLDNPVKEEWEEACLG